jgi:hypothetical protein
MSRQQPERLDLLAVPLRDDSCGLVQLGAARGAAHGTLVLQGLRDASPAALARRARALTAADAIGCVDIDAGELARAGWPIIGRERLQLSSPAPSQKRHGRAVLVTRFLEAYHQLRAWDARQPGPATLSAIILPGIAPPPGERAWLLARLDAYADAPAAACRALRAEVIDTRLYERYARLALPDRATAPLEFILRVLLTASLCDGYPDPRDHYMAIAYLTPLAQERGIDLRPHLDRVAALSSERLQLLLRGRLEQTRW